LDLPEPETEVASLALMKELDRMELKIKKPNGVELQFSSSFAKK